VLLTRSVDKLCKRIGDITDTMHVAAEGAVNASGSLSSSGNGPGAINTSAERGLGAWKSKSAHVEDAPGTVTSTEEGETPLYWESRGEFCTAPDPPQKKT